MTKLDPPKKPRPVWYFITTITCVLCGRETIYREGRYNEKPREWDKCHKYQQDACEDHFL